ncbi:MAG TPA: LysM peptidoglycan-binding domain-containing protein, partial [Paludibacter sp.]|nr:LysM peptidoglycan-binding domain-containing protein [Paludibacter sp.]
MPLQPKFTLLIFTCFACLAPKAQQFPGTKPVAAMADTTSHKTNYLSPAVSITDSIVNYGKLFLNTPYHYGASGTNAFDCSGFTSFVYRNFGYNLERSSCDQARQFDTVRRNELKAGDLVFFSGRRKSKSVGHVGIVTNASDGNFSFIHASVHDGVIISNSDEEYYSKRFITANRVIDGTKTLAFAKTGNAAVKADPTSNMQSLPYPVNIPARPSRKVIPAEYHRVRRGETLSDIAQKYGLSVAELKEMNDIKGNKINARQRLKIKTEETLLVVEPLLAGNADSAKSVAPKHGTDALPQPVADAHVVKKGETFYSIAALYHISVAELKKLNNMQGSALKAGQKLKVTAPVENQAPVAASIQKPGQKAFHKVLHGETLTSIAKHYNLSVGDLKRLNNLTGAEIRPGQELKVNAIAEVAQNEPASVSSPKKEIATKTETYEVKSGESL